jgi:hypothetical protein
LAALHEAVVEPGQHSHIVQFYDHDPELLAANAARYLSEGWIRGEGLIVIATAGHIDAFMQELQRSGIDPLHAMKDGYLAMASAEETLERFMVDE